MKRNSSYSVLVLAVMVFIIAVVSCQHEPFVNSSLPPSGIDTVIGSGPNGSICFEDDILYIFTTSCTGSNVVKGCHDAASHEKGYVFDNPANIIKKGIIKGNPGASRVFTVLIEKDADERMPKSPFSISDSQVDKIWQWIKNGADTTKNCNTTKCDTSNVTYTTISSLLNARGCYNCHKSPSPVGKYDLTSYDALKAMAVSGRLMKALDRTGPFPMPSSAEAKFKTCELGTVRTWIRNNYPK